MGLIAFFVMMLLAIATTAVFAHDPSNHEFDQWYRTLMQPDMPSMMCCGEQDGYWADSYEITKTGEYVAIVTDERDDKQFGQYGRVHVPVGTRVVIPKYKIKFDQSNPTGHGIVFMNAQQLVFCYLPPGGV